MQYCTSHYTTLILVRFSSFNKALITGFLRVRKSYYSSTIFFDLQLSNLPASFMDFVGCCFSFENFTYSNQAAWFFQCNLTYSLYNFPSSFFPVQSPKIISYLTSSPLLYCITGGPLGAAGSNTCFNYETTTKKSLRILGEELGVFCAIIGTFHNIFFFL